MNHTNHKDIESFLETRLPGYLELLRRMVDINSFTANPVGVNALGDLTAEAFAKLGFVAERVQAADPDFGQHLVMTREGTSGKKIGLISHLDTVFTPEEELANDFCWRPEGDRIYGPGTNDIKGGTVMIYMVLEALKEYAFQVFDEVTWVILLNAAEERLCIDFGELCLDHLAPNALAGLVFEAGRFGQQGFHLVTARKGMAMYQITVEGRAAHAGSFHQLGANALVQLAHTITHVAELTDYDRDLTFNIGMISSGSVTNRVPHHAEAYGEMRTFLMEVFEDGINKLLALGEASNVSSEEDGFPCKVDVEILRQTAPWSPNQGTNHLLSIWESTAKRLGTTVLREERGGLSDGNHLWEKIPTIDGLGPNGGFAHCSEWDPESGKEPEYVTVSSFVPKAVLNSMAILELIRSSKK
jgi:glutamate carboxypeptidase